MANSIHDGHRDRMKQRFLRNGLDIFEPHQVLEMLLFYVLPRRDTNPIAHALLKEFGTLSNVLDADYASLCRVEGISKQAALFLTFCGSLVGRYMEAKVSNETVFRNLDDMRKYLQARFVNATKEKLYVLCMNSRGKLLSCSMISEGSVNTTDLNLREIIQTVLKFPTTTTVVLAHNHPSGYATPSQADLDSTLQAKLALNGVGVRLIDHIIFSQDGYISLGSSPKYASHFASVMKDDGTVDWS